MLRLFPLWLDDKPVRALRDLNDKIAGLPVHAALDACYDGLQQALATTGQGPRVRRLLDVIHPTALRLAHRAEHELNAQPQHTVRLELLGKRLHGLANQLANTLYLECMRESVAIQRGQGDADRLVQLAQEYAQWLAVDLTAAARLQPGTRALDTDAFLALVHALHTHAGQLLTLPAPPGPLEHDLGLVWLLSDRLPAARDAAEAGSIGRACRAVAGNVSVSATFWRLAPLWMSASQTEARRWVGWETAQHARAHGVFVGAALAAAHLRQAAQHGLMDAPSGGAVPNEPLPPVPVQLLTDMADALDANPLRAVHPVAQPMPPISMAFDFLRIRGLLGQKTSRVPGSDPLISQGTLHDADEIGINVVMPREDVRQAQTGLMALYFSDRGWSLAAVHAVLPDPDGALVVARWLGQQAEPIRLGPQRDVAIWVHGDDHHGQHAGVLCQLDALPNPCPVHGDAGNHPTELRLSPAQALGKQVFWYAAQRA